METEVEKAKSFRPELSEFIIATSGPKDARIEQLARKITAMHLREGLFSVNIFGWEDIVARLDDFPALIDKHFPGLSLDAKKLENSMDEVKRLVQDNHDTLMDIKHSVSSSSEEARESKTSIDVDASIPIPISKHKTELDDVENLIDDYRPERALERLEKLEENLLDAPETVKYRLLVLRARAMLYLNEDREAARFLIEAWQYSSKNDKALSNIALGHLLLNQREKAQEYAKKALKRNPANGIAYSVLVQSFPDEEELESIIAEIPEAYRTIPEVAHAIGYLAGKRGNFIEAEKWLDTAVEKDKSGSPYPKAELGEVLLYSVVEDKRVLYTKQLTDAQGRKAQKALQLLTSAWERIENTEVQNSNVSWIANRGSVKRILGDINGAISDIEIALRIKPSDPIFMMKRAVLAYENNDYKTAISLARQIPLSNETYEVVFLLSRALWEEGEFLEATRTLTDFLKTDSSEEVKKETRRLLILLYIESQDLLAARNLLETLRSAEPTNVLYLVDAARISRASGNYEEAISYLKSAAQHLVDSPSFRELLELADEFYVAGELEDAINIYERFVDKSLKTPSTYRLLDCYFRSGKTGKALEMCQILRQKHHPLERVSEIEAAIYEDMGDLEGAKNTCQQYLNEFPEDFRMKLRLAMIDFRLCNFDKVDEFLNSSIQYNKLPVDGFLLARLYASRNLTKKAFETIYEVRRNFPNEGNVHLNYVQFFFFMENESLEWLNPNRVGKNTAVCIEDVSGSREWYIIEDRGDVDTLRNEISVENNLAKELIDKSVGDRFCLKRNRFSTEFGTIIEIRSKYAYALHRSISLLSSTFRDIAGFWEIRVGPMIEEGKFTEGFQKILDEISTQYNTLKKVTQLYAEKRIPIGTFAELIRRNVLDVWDGLRRDPGLGIKCCFGTTEERNHAALLLEKKPKLVIDIISLLTLHEMKAGEIILQTFGRLGIAQSTIDLLQRAIDERRFMYSRKVAKIWREGEGYVVHEVTIEEAERDIRRLEGIMNWVKSNCDTIPCRAALNRTKAEKQKLNDMVGQSSIDTVLIAGEPGNILYSDDLSLRALGKGEFGVDGIWTQALLLYSMKERIIEVDEFNKIIINLACSNYQFTIIDADILIEAAAQSRCLPSPPYTTVLQILRGGSSDDVSALKVGTEFLFKLWRVPIPSVQRNLLVYKLLDTLTAGRDSEIVLNNLAFPKSGEFAQLVDLWKRMGEK